MNVPPSEFLSREERGEQDAASIGAFYKRLMEDGVPSEIADQITYQYAVHLYLSARAGVSK